MVNYKLILSIVFIFIITTITIFSTTYSGDKLVINEQYYEESFYCKGFIATKENKIDMRMKGTSMLPAILPDSNLYGKKISPSSNVNNLRTGDIVAIEVADKQYMIHRVYGIYDDYFMTKGDNNYYHDSEYWTMKKVKYIICGVSW